MLDGAVLAGRVHGLKNQQQRPAILGVEDVLFLCEPLGSAPEQRGRIAFVQLQPAGVAGVEVLQLKAFAFGDAERMDVLLDWVQDLFFSPWRNLPSPNYSLAPDTRVAQSFWDESVGTLRVPAISSDRCFVANKRGRDLAGARFA